MYGLRLALAVCERTVVRRSNLVAAYCCYNHNQHWESGSNMHTCSSQLQKK